MTQRVALITGGMGGLGETISVKMADAKYRVAVTYSPSNKTSGQWLSGMKEKGYEFQAYPCDVADYESCKTCVDTVARDFGPIDILVNNAGITRDITFRKMTKADWDAVMHTNLDSAFNMTKQVYDGMMDRSWGRIINVSSVNGSRGVRPDQLRSGEGGHARLHEVARSGIGAQRCHGEHHLAGLYRHQDGHRDS
jgi:acetoacetyl-CoA reductase